MAEKKGTPGPAFRDNDPIIIYGDPDVKPKNWREDLAKQPEEDIEDPEDFGENIAVRKLVGVNPDKWDKEE